VIFCGDLSVGLAAWSCELPQLDWISFRVMQASKPPIGVGLRINFHLNAGSSQLSCHFIQIAYPKVYHPYLARILEIASRFWERTEHGRTSFLLPNRIIVARWRKRDSQMLPVPASQAFRVFGSEKKSLRFRLPSPFRSSPQCRV
jgi:hypothetical protein